MIPSSILNHQNYLIAGIGGGFDIYGGIPLLDELIAHGKTVVLSSFNTSDCREFGITNKHSNCYPESYLSDICPVPVYTLPKTGVMPALKSYEKIVGLHQIDVIIGIDGGVDSLMCGNEDGCGTILEDSVSLAALDDVKVKQKILACIGFGAETDESVCHYHVLKNIASLTKAGAFLGACSMSNQEQYFKALEYSWDGRRKSHIHTKIISSLKGEFGNSNLYKEVDPRLAVASSEADFINPLMSIYWFFNMEEVIAKNQLVSHLKKSNTGTDALMIFRQFFDLINRENKIIPRHSIPL